MAKNVADTALQLLRTYPRVAMDNIKKLPGGKKKVRNDDTS